MSKIDDTTEVITNEKFKLRITNSVSGLSLRYTPNGYWTDVVSGSFRSSFGKKFEAEISTSSGGSADNDIDVFLNFTAAIEDCHKRLKEAESQREMYSKREEAHYIKLKEESDKANVERLEKLEYLKSTFKPLDNKDATKLINNLIKGIEIGSWDTITVHLLNEREAEFEEKVIHIDKPYNGNTRIYFYAKDGHYAPHNKTTKKEIIRILETVKIV